jgi:hypothetical protein
MVYGLTERIAKVETRQDFTMVLLVAIALGLLAALIIIF